MRQNILIFGATSAIAEAVAQRYAEQSAQLFLVARNSDKLRLVKQGLIKKGASDVQTFVMDANKTELLPEALDRAWGAFGSIDMALVAHGIAFDPTRILTEMPLAIAEFRTNAESVIICLASLALRFETQEKGVIAVISSIAGDRGRASYYLYGAAKAAINTYASGLSARLYKKNVHVLIIKPGFVTTPMTEKAQVDLPEFLKGNVTSVSHDILNAIEKRKNVLYTPWFWRYFMWFIRLIPTELFKRMQI